MSSAEDSDGLPRWEPLQTAGPHSLLTALPSLLVPAWGPPLAGQRRLCWKWQVFPHLAASRPPSWSCKNTVAGRLTSAPAERPLLAARAFGSPRDPLPGTESRPPAPACRAGQPRLFTTRDTREFPWCPCAEQVMSLTPRRTRSIHSSAWSSAPSYRECALVGRMRDARPAARVLTPPKVHL